MKDDEVLLINQTLFGAWLCVPSTRTEEELMPEIMRVLTGTNSVVDPPVTDPNLVKDRLYGGFQCELSDSRRHVFFALLQYTFTGVNVPLTKEERIQIWHELFEANVEDNNQPTIGDGPFTADLEEALETWHAKGDKDA